MHGKSYEEVQVQKLQVRIELYRMIHMEAMELVYNYYWQR